MGKINVFTLLTATVVQLVIGYFWYGSYMFGDVITASGGHAIDFLKFDVLSLVLVVLGTYGLTTLMDTVVKLTGTKDVNSGIKLALTVGGFGIGLPTIMLLNLMGTSKVVLLVVFCHIVLITSLINIIILKLKKV